MESIASILRKIERREIVLPAIQRSFVWSTDQITQLMDSLMRRYPIGLALLWDTYAGIEFRCFAQHYVKSQREIFDANRDGRGVLLVIDGQQRLQSLYLAAHGSYEGAYLYFDLLSGGETEDTRRTRFHFAFYRDVPAPEAGNPVRHWVRVSDLIDLGFRERLALQNEISSARGLSGDQALQLAENLATLDEVLNDDRQLLQTATIDHGLSADDKRRTSPADVVEIFVRLNDQGTPLDEEELVFSLIKLHWHGAVTAFPELLAELNRGHSLRISQKFVVRCLYAIADLGPKVELDRMRNSRDVQAMQDRFELTSEAIRSAVDFLRYECGIADRRLLKRLDVLVPVVYYLAHCPKQVPPPEQTAALRKLAFILAFLSPREAVLSKIIKGLLRPRVTNQNLDLPLAEVIAAIGQTHARKSPVLFLAEENPILALHLLQNRVAGEELVSSNQMQLDHIFPKARLLQRDVPEAEIDHPANLWLLPKNRNANKGAKDPRRYFANADAGEMKRALINPKKLDYDSFKSFMAARKRRIQAALSDHTGLTSELLRAKPRPRNANWHAEVATHAAKALCIEPDRVGKTAVWRDVSGRSLVCLAANLRYDEFPVCTFSIRGAHLDEDETRWFALGCGSAEDLLLIPGSEMRVVLSQVPVPAEDKGNRMIHIRIASGHCTLMHNGHELADLTQFLVQTVKGVSPRPAGGPSEELVLL